MPKWDEEASTLISIEDRVKLYVMGTTKEDCFLCGSRVLAKTYNVIRSAITTVGLTGEVVPVSSCQPFELRWERNQSKKQFDSSVDGGVCAENRERACESGFVFEGFEQRPGGSLHLADASTDAATFLHPLILGFMLLERSQLTPTEHVPVLATFRSTTKEGRTIGHGYLFTDVVGSFSAQGTTKQFNVATNPHLTDVQRTWPLPHRRGKSNWSL